MGKYSLSANIIYKTKLTKEQTINKLAENVGKDFPFDFSFFDNNNDKHSKPYIGTINSDSFKIKRTINHKNSFLPVIKGEIFEDKEGTKIKVNMKLHSFISTFVVIWLTGASLFCVISIFQIFTEEFSLLLLIPFGMLFFGISLSFGGFTKESIKSIADLKVIFEAYEVLEVDEVKVNGKIELIKELLENGANNEFISEITQISEGEIEQLRQEIATKKTQN